MTLPNGIVLTYTYDNDSLVTAMTWTLGSAAVGDLEYQYDADSRVIQKTGSFAQTNLPQAVTGNTFNAANEMTSFNGTPQTYDANGNLANDGTNTYSWDAQNHLTAIVGPNTASFAYDADGRRAQKTIDSTSTQFLYDGSNPVQEIQNGAPSANLITGRNPRVRARFAIERGPRERLSQPDWRESANTSLGAICLGPRIIAFHSLPIFEIEDLPNIYTTGKCGTVDISRVWH